MSRTGPEEHVPEGCNRDGNLAKERVRWGEQRPWEESSAQTTAFPYWAMFVLMVAGYAVMGIFGAGAIFGYIMKRPERVVAYMPDSVMEIAVKGAMRGETDERVMVMPGFSKGMERVNPTPVGNKAKRVKRTE